MGQGVHTSIAQVVADELGARWEQVVVEQGTSSVGPRDDEGTVGSFSTEKTFEPVRRAAAEMRQMLLEEAARRLDTTPASVVVNEGRVVSDNGDALTFGEIVRDVDSWREPVTKPTLIDASTFRFIGKPMPRIDYAAKLRGEPVYGYDLRVDGMLYGAVARSPYLEARLTRAAPGKAEGMPGVVKVVIDEQAGFAGVAARTRRQAAQAVKALDVAWDEGRHWSSQDIDALLVVDEHKGAVIQNEGDALAATSGENAYRAEYATPLGANSPLEPPAALADAANGRITVRISTQNAQLVKHDIAKMLNVDAGTIEVIPAYIGGGFGRKDDNAVAIEAVRLSRAAGKPVHVGWTREEDMRNGRYRPPTRHRLAAVTGDGRVDAISHSMISGIILAPEILMHQLPFDFGVVLEGSWQYGKIANRRFNAQSIRLPVPTGPWRGLASMPNCFAVESFLDELAHREGVTRWRSGSLTSMTRKSIPAAVACWRPSQTKPAMAATLLPGAPEASHVEEARGQLSRCASK
jgi:isoquinoline 1-oxidoreductase beta subunit